jgi:glycosyltransferase involved in cell wall biosynthesis
MKKKIIIVGHAMRLGGVETSLIGLLKSLDYSKFEVDLFLYLHDGDFMEFIPKEVNLLPQNKLYASLMLPISQNKPMLILSKLMAKLYSYFYRKLNQINGENFVYFTNLHQIAHWFLPNLNANEYDLGISFLTPHFTIANKVKTKRKIAWIHTDYSKYALDRLNELKMWQSFDYVASIGEDSAKTFSQIFPKLADKVILIENILPREFVIQRSNAFEVNFEKECVNICSVGRFTYPKNFDSVPEITRYLLDHQIRVKWYLIGYGGDEDLIKAKIKEYGVEEEVIILGKKSNPYPYIKACDIYVQPSRYEGKAVTVREAQTLAKPVVITNFSSANSQLKNGIDGVILPLETLALAEKLKNFINDIDLQKKLITNCRIEDFSNHNEIDKIYKLIK